MNQPADMENDLPPTGHAATLPSQVPPGAGKVTVSCLRCRSQKLKCNRELPSCVRCRQHGAACHYPSAPDRRRIAQKTSQARARAKQRANALLRDGGDEIVGPSESSIVNKSNNRRHANVFSKEDSHDASPNSDNPIDVETTDLPSTEVGLLLLEIYFKQVYNSTLLFHKTVTFQLYLQNDLPDYLLRAIYAHAAIFLEQFDTPYKEYIRILPVQTLLQKSWSWARSASQQVLSYADEPTLVIIQTLQVLQFYYFSRNETQRAVIHASLAYRLNPLLGYDRLLDDVSSSSSANCNIQFDHEMKRRCFWASWCTLCIGGSRLEPSSTWDNVAGLPLPAKFEKRKPGLGVELMLGQKMDGAWETSSRTILIDGTQSEQFPGSLMAELVKILRVWAKVQEFLAESHSHHDTQRMNQRSSFFDILELIEHHIDWPFIDLCARAESYNESIELITNIYSVYFVSRLLLHASMVPILSGCSGCLRCSREPTPNNADIVLEQATAFARLLRQFIRNNLDITRLWPFLGYGAFMAGSVFVVYKNNVQSARSTNQSLHTPGMDSDEMSSVRTVLEVLSLYWKPLRVMAVKLNESIEMGQHAVLDSITSPMYPWYTPSHPNHTAEKRTTHYRYDSAVPKTLSLRGVNESGSIHDDSYPAVLDDGHVSSLRKADTENHLLHTLHYGFQSGFHNTFLEHDDAEILDLNWWGITPTANASGFPRPLGEVPQETQ